MSYSPKSIANCFLDLAAASGEQISPMKLQKLVYYANGWHLGYTGQPLIDETVEAWQYGPVISSLYHEFKQWGSGPIRSKATEFQRMRLEEVAAPADAGLRIFLENVWKSYGKFTAIRLSEMTHAVGSPWDKAWKAAGGVKGTDIPISFMREHFGELAAKARQQQVA